MQYAYIYIFSDTIPENIVLSAAHKIWSESELSGVPTPFGLSRQKETAVTPADIIKVELKCIIRSHRGFWGFDGFFLSLLINTITGDIWDARGGITGIDI